MLSFVQFSPLYAELILFYCYSNSCTLPYMRIWGGMILSLIQFPLCMQNLSYFTVISITPPMRGLGALVLSLVQFLPLFSELVLFYYFSNSCTLPYMGISGGLILCLVKYSFLHVELISFTVFFNSYLLARDGDPNA